MPQRAVLTGDFIHSSNLSPDDLDSHMTSVQIALEDWRDADGPDDHHFTRQSGDGWQAVIRPPEKALRASLFIRAWLRRNGAKRDTRIFIAEGNVTLPENSNLNEATGPVFTASGRGLDNLGRRAEFGHAAGGPMAATVRLADHISRSWTEAQARILVETLKFPRTQEEIANRLGVSQQSVQQTLSAAGYQALSEALEFIEKANHD